MTLGATLFEYRNVSLPRTLSADEEVSDAVAWEAKVLERIGMTEEAMHTIDELFRLFLDLRLSPDWPQELAKLKNWIVKSAEK